MTSFADDVVEMVDQILSELGMITYTALEEEIERLNKELENLHYR